MASGGDITKTKCPKTPEDIVMALEIIKETCEHYTHKSHGTCSGCPLLNSNDNCGIEIEAPCDWEINKPDTWKAL